MGTFSLYLIPCSLESFPALTPWSKSRQQLNSLRKPQSTSTRLNPPIPAYTRYYLSFEAKDIAETSTLK